MTIMPDGGHAEFIIGRAFRATRWLCPPYDSACPPPDHAERLHQKAVLRLVVCRFWQWLCHLSKNIRETTRWRVLRRNEKAFGRAATEIVGTA
jgi:hypothetical protein